MSNNVKDIFASRKFPTFITGNKVFKSFKKINKVFPELGLPNCEEEVNIDNSKKAIASAKALSTEIQREMAERTRKMKDHFGKKENVSEGRKSKITNCAKLITDIHKQIKSPKCITSNNGRITLNLIGDVSDSEGKVVFKSGEGLLRVYNKLNETLREGKFLPMNKFEDMYAFKQFSSKNIPGLKYTIRFSSDGPEGVWDIATMSMRGISSCQTWGSTTSYHVVGSMVDPFTGIIYLTSGDKDATYGSKMIRRCIVRFLVNTKSKTPFLGLERMYPAMDTPTVESFISFIKKRVDNKLDVVYLGDGRSSPSSFYVPMSKVVSSLSQEYQPYRDSQIDYKTDINDTEYSFKETLMPKLEVIYSGFASKIAAALRTIKLGSMTEESAAAINIYRGTNDKYDRSYALYQDLYARMKNDISKFDQSKYKDPSIFLEESLEHFLKDSLEDKIFTEMKVSITKRTPKSVKKMDDSILREVSKIGTTKVEKYLNSEIKKLKAANKLSAAKKAVGSNPLVPVYVKLLS